MAKQIAAYTGQQLKNKNTGDIVVAEDIQTVGEPNKDGFVGGQFFSSDAFEVVKPDSAEVIDAEKIDQVPEVTMVYQESSNDVKGKVDQQTQTIADLTIKDITNFINSETLAEKQRADLVGKLAEGEEQLVGKELELLKEEERLGIGENIKKLQGLSTQIAQLQSELDLGLSQEETRPIPRQFIVGRQAEMKRQASVEIGALATVAQAIQGNVALARQTAERTTDLKYAPVEREIANIKELIELNYQDLSRADKKRADNLNVILSERERVINEEKSNRNLILEMGLSAAEKGANGDTIQSILNSESPEMALYNSGESLRQLVDDSERGKLLSPTEASTLGVPYGTTRGQAADMGVVPKSTLNPTDKINQEFKMSKQVDTATKESGSAIRQLETMETAWDTIKSGMESGEIYNPETGKNEKFNLNAPSQAMLVTFQKLLDPTSVVRESEYARSGEGSSLRNRIEGAYDKLNRGGAGVTVEDLYQFYTLSQDLLNNYKSDQLDTIRRTRTQAGEWDLNLNTILKPDSIRLLEDDDQRRWINLYNDLNDENRGVADAIVNDNPEVSNYDLLRIFGSGFKKDLSMSLKDSYPEGSDGGQCTTFLHEIADFPAIGDYKDEKFASVDRIGINKKDWMPNVGDIVVTDESKRYGHTAIVNDILPDGTLVLTESNFASPETVTHSRNLSPESKRIYGAIRPKKINI
jgi:hypothetical protein